jgi:hypothetical protein
MNKTLGILFYVKRAKIDNNNKAPIYVRITSRWYQKRIKYQTKHRIRSMDTKAGKVKGTNRRSKSINTYIDVVRIKIYEHQKKLIDNNKPVTAEAIKNSFLGIEEKQRTIVAIFNTIINK